ncbi:hypothetical protein AV530_019338 [Patagioenas fasciata monilis]|uniref:Uncharacterized protein n=1 Tax=Patagioenas fasciata monilis TaxID=372326 RepID=A0A1V4JEB1_PATFA|nr:hypothetical protein AV530_019338 [Patagioenas fasciata monilis]
MKYKIDFVIHCMPAATAASPSLPARGRHRRAGEPVPENVAVLTMKRRRQLLALKWMKCLKLKRLICCSLKAELVQRCQNSRTSARESLRGHEE